MINLFKFFGFDGKAKRPTGRIGYTMHMIEMQKFKSLIDSGMFPDEALRVSGITDVPLSKKQEEEKKRWDEIQGKRNKPLEKAKKEPIWPMVIDGTDIINQKKI